MTATVTVTATTTATMDNQSLSRRAVKNSMSRIHHDAPSPYIARRQADKHTRLTARRLAQPSRHRSGHGDWSSFTYDGIDLAHDEDTPLPTDRAPSIQRCPSLEREDAFCDARTSKPRNARAPRLVRPGDDDAQVAQLYSMGLLYDEADAKMPPTENLHLDDLHHNEPIYPIRKIRHPRRRGGAAKSGAAKARDGDYDGPLPLNLSFADLGNDDDLARYIRGGWPSSPGADADKASGAHRRTASGQSEPPLRVIYELATARPSYDVDTSQAPDLMDDGLSDYDYFDDVEVGHGAGGLSQTEVGDAHTSDSWVLLGDDS